MPLFSIIIPVYNYEKLIKKCLLSILKQKFSDYEIIIINDCSRDRSLEICKKYKKKYPLIKIINNKVNKGVSFSRNSGIRFSTGKYIILLDADDYLENHSLKRLSKFIAHKHYPDVIMGRHNDNSDGNLFIKNKKRLLKSNEEKIKIINKVPYFTGYCCRFVTKKKFLEHNKIFFTNARQFEDEDFTCKLIIYTKSIVFFENKFYFKRSAGKGLSHITNHITTKSSVIVLKSLLKLFSLKRISAQRKIFCKSRIEMVLRHLYPSIFFSTTKELKMLSQYIYKNISLFLLLKKYNQKNGFGKIVNENKKDSLLKCKKIIEINTISKICNMKDRNFYIFCLDRNSYALSKILLKHKFKIKGFLDNNIELKDRDKTNMNFLPAREWLKRIKNDDKNYLIICNQRKEHVLQILSQVIKSGFSKNRIFIKSFNLNLKEKLKTNNEY